MFELLKRLKPLYLMNLPYSCTDGQLDYWRNEVLALKVFLENQTGRIIEEAELSKQVRIQNEIRRLLKQITGLCANTSVPLSGMDMMVVLESKSFVVDLEDYAELLRELRHELKTRIDNGISVCKDDAPRILLTGCPVGKGSEKTLRMIEECGGIVICQENVPA